MREAELAKMRAFQQRKHQTLNRQREALFSKAYNDFQRIIEMIVKKYGPTRIYQWGSLLDKTRFREYSDIDIAVEGITDAAAFFALIDEADRMTDFPIDIVMLESIHPLHAASIRTKGKCIHGKK